MINNKLISNNRGTGWIPTVYEAFSHSGGCIIILRNKILVPRCDTKTVEELNESFTKESKYVIDGVTYAYQTWTGSEIITLMHRKDSPCINIASNTWPKLQSGFYY